MITRRCNWWLKINPFSKRILTEVTEESLWCLYALLKAYSQETVNLNIKGPFPSRRPDA